MSYAEDRVIHRMRPEQAPAGGTGILWTVFIVVAALFLAGLYVDSSAGVQVSWFNVGVNAGQLFVLVVGLSSLILLKRQIDDQRKTMQLEFNWKRLIIFHELFSCVPGHDIGEKIWQIIAANDCRDCFEGLGSPLPADKLESITKDPKDEFAIRTYLDEFEKFCAAVRVGLIDQEYAYLIQCGRVLRTYEVFKPFIDGIQQRNSKAYLELEKMAAEWKHKRESDAASARRGQGVQNGIWTG